MRLLSPRKNLRILLAGRFPRISLESSYFRAFKKLGQRVEKFDLEESYQKISRLFDKIFWKKIAQKRDQKFIQKAQEFKPDFILIFKGRRLSPETLKVLKEKLPETMLFNFNPDGVFSPFSSSVYIRQSVPFYDCLFTPRDIFFDKLYKLGAKKIVWLPYGYDPELHYPIRLSPQEKEKFQCEISFIGRWAPEQRVKWLKAIVQKGWNLKIWGNAWENLWPMKPLFRINQLFGKDLPKSLIGLGTSFHKTIQGSPVYGKDFAKAVGGSKINLGFLRHHDKDFHTMRTFEIPACGGFFLGERTPHHQEFFKEGEEAEFFESTQELLEKIKYYLKHEKKRKAIAQAGYQRLKKSPYAYQDRARQILKIFKKLKT